MKGATDPLCTDPHLTDPPLLRNHSVFKSYKTSHAEYRDLRVFFREHAKADELYRSNGPLPLLVCIPGLGGTVAQFHPLLSSLVDLAPCLCIDYPGMGRSKFEPTNWEAYTAEALGELLETVIEDFRDKEADQTVVLIGHSMGTTHAAWLASTKVKHTTPLAEYVVGVVAICPLAAPMDEAKTRWARRLMWIPEWLFMLLRFVDGIGGPESPSVARFVGPDAEPELKLLQYRFNQQSRTPVWRRMFYGALPVYVDGRPEGGVAGLDVWAGLDIPVYLIAGEKDGLTPPSEVHKIMNALNGKAQDEALSEPAASSVEGVESAAPFNTSTRPSDHLPRSPSDIHEEDFQKIDAKDATTPESSQEPDDPFDDPSTPQETLAEVPPQPRHPKKVVQHIVLPAPANHTLLYMPRCVRAVAGLLSDFLATHVTGRLSLGWQLQYLSQEGKWDVKNLNKWKSVAPVSDPIGPPGKPLFRALKTLREADDVHCPKEFVVHWGDTIRHVVDISKDQPVYDPRGLERAGIQYHKFPTVSKVPPTGQEVADFIEVIDKIRARDAEEADDDGKVGLIGVHCHYGFNRTGYFIVCYLVERCGFDIKGAIEEFAAKRPNGIKHSHFLDRLYVRYGVEAALSDGEAN
jgi:pimeloyl-ACP methyl ester carboxylesterase/protein-tyrosine phosphatase